MSSDQPDFSPASLPDDVRELVESATQAIHAATEVQTESVFDIGRHLNAVKHKLEHGQFGAWLKTEFRFSRRTAENYMAVATKLEGHQEMLQRFSPGTLYALASGSVDKFRKKLLREIEAGKLTSDDAVSDRIAKLKPTRQEDEKVRQQREAYLAETVSVISRNAGEELPTLVELLRHLGIRELADRLAATLPETGTEEEPADPEQPAGAEGETGQQAGKPQLTLPATDRQ